MVRGLFFVQLAVADWPAAVAWYRDVLGLRLAFRNDADRFALLDAGGCRVALKEGPPEPGNVLLTFEVDDLPATLARLAARGVTLESPTEQSEEGYRRARLRDPDGHSICLFEWNGGVPPEVWASEQKSTERHSADAD
jgi:catechol 2,3-dioxygenase-like lactoylglutathione lyase family enzyme